METFYAEGTFTSDAMHNSQQEDDEHQYFKIPQYGIWTTAVWKSDGPGLSRCRIYELLLTSDGKVAVLMKKNKEYKNAGIYKITTNGIDIDWTHQGTDESTSLTSHAMDKLDASTFKSRLDNSLLVFGFPVS